MADKIDADVFIFTGIPATPEDVLGMLADPDNPLTPDDLENLPPEQRPDPDAVVGVLGK